MKIHSETDLSPISITEIAAQLAVIHSLKILSGERPACMGGKVRKMKNNYPNGGHKMNEFEIFIENKD